MKTRNLLSLLLAAVLALGMMSGCIDAAAEESGSFTLGIWPEDTQTEAIASMECRLPSSVDSYT